MSTSFASDIAPVLAPYRESMTWRFDLTDYNAVKANADLIYSKISGTDGTPMPPPPMPPLRSSDLAMFNAWMTDGCPP